MNQNFPQGSILISNLSKRNNFGTIIRTGSVFGLTDFFVVGCEKLRTFGNQGTLKRVDFHNWKSLEKFKDFAHSHGAEICGVEIADNAEPIHTAKFDKPVVFVLGNEGSGMSEKQMKICDRLVYIKQYSSACESMNVAVAAGIIFHHWALYTEQRESDKIGNAYVLSDSRPKGLHDELADPDTHTREKKDPHEVTSDDIAFLEES